MKKSNLIYIVLVSIALNTLSSNVNALTGVHPTGVNVRTNGPTTAFLTFQGVAGQTPTDAYWCGDITIAANTVVNFDPCVANTYFGRLPQRNNLSRDSGTGGVSNLTDIMTIPSAVSRKALQAAREGSKSSFFYIRKFSQDGVDQYVAVTCRLAGGGARVPLALMHVTPYFATTEGRQPVQLLARGTESPKAGATIYYNGSGRLKGRWEIVQPGDEIPSEFDLLPEASLPVEDRSSQRRYPILKRFDMFVPPTGKIDLSGPSPKSIPTDVSGPYQLILRIEATTDKEGDSNTGAGTVHSGGVAGFSMPPLRYYVAEANEVASAKLKQSNSSVVTLVQPTNQQVISNNLPIEFSWNEIDNVVLYRIELSSDTQTEWQAYVKPGIGRYQSPPWWVSSTGAIYQWKVTAIGENNSELGNSDWRELMISEN